MANSLKEYLNEARVVNKYSSPAAKKYWTTVIELDDIIDDIKMMLDTVSDDNGPDAAVDWQKELVAEIKRLRPKK